MQKFLKNYVYPIATLSGSIIGVGIFSLPYIASRVGIWAMLVYFLLLGGLVILIHCLFGKVALKTPDRLRLPGFAKIYLGDWGKIAAAVSMAVGFIGAILAYLIVGGEFLSNLLSPVLGGGDLFWTLVYFAAGALLIFFGIKAIAKIEFWGLILFFVILFLIFWKAFPQINLSNFFVSDFGFKISDFFLPYGPILFSLWGASLIPEIEEMLGSQKSLLKKIIPISILIPILVYLFFIYLVLGITGDQTTESALPGLKNHLGGFIFNLGLFFGVLTTFTSFAILGLTLKKTLWYDFKIPRIFAWAIACFLPLFLFLAGFKSFISVISLVGAIMLAVDGILILLMYQKIGGKKALIWPLFLALFTGIVYEIINTLQ
ncbi:MAG: aromatic amino acid transport family protein [bacterium]